MVIVMQFFTADQDAPRRNVTGGIGALEVAIAPVMTDAVDDPGSEQWNPHHLNRPHGDTGGTKQQQVDHRHQSHAAHGEAGIDIALNPVVRAAGAILFQGFLIFRFFTIKLSPFAEDFFDAFDLRAVRVVFGFAFGVVLAVDGGPLESVLSGGQPQPEAKKMFQHRMQFQGPVGGIAVQVYSDADNSDMGHGQGDQNQHTQARGQQAVAQIIQHENRTR